MMLSVLGTQVVPVRVLLVDDSSTYRETVRLILSTEEGINVVGEAGDGRDSLTQASLLKPDVVLLDCSMPEMDGPAAARLLRRQHPKIRIIGLSVGDDEDCLHRMAEAGVEEFLSKADGPEEIARAITRDTA
jgi:two-component system NarL family response regulator